MYCVYRYTNTKNGKVYIGQTSKTLAERAQANGRNYKECRKFYAAIQKYGWDSFEPDILADDLTLDEANRLETFYINFFDSTNDLNGYNIAFGGDNKEFSEESKLIISKKAKERYINPENNPMYGKKHSELSIHKMRDAKLGDKNPMFGTKWNDTQKNTVRHGWTYEWTDERRKNASDKFKKTAMAWTKKVRCIEDDICFDSAQDAAKHYGVSKSTLSGHLNGYQKSCAGKHFEVIQVGV